MLDIKMMEECIKWVNDNMHDICYGQLEKSIQERREYINGLISNAD